MMEFLNVNSKFIQIQRYFAYQISLQHFPHKYYVPHDFFWYKSFNFFGGKMKDEAVDHELVYSVL